MMWRLIGERRASCTLESRLDILLLYLYLLDNRAEIIHDIYWQERILSKIGGSDERGERRRVRVRMLVDKAYLEEDFSGVRVNGRITEASEEGVKDRYTGFDLALGETILLEGDEEGMKMYLSAPRRKAAGRAILLLMDDHEASVTFVDDIPSPLWERWYDVEGGYGKEGSLDLKRRIAPALEVAIQEAERRGAKLIIASSSIFMKILKGEVERRRPKRSHFIEGPFSGSYFGALELLRSPQFREVAGDVPAAMESRYMEIIKQGMIQGEITYGLQETTRRVEGGGTRIVLLTTNLALSTLKEDPERMRRLLLGAKDRRIEVSIIHPKGELGGMIDALGGVIAL